MKRFLSSKWVRSILIGLTTGSIAFLLIYFNISIPIPGTQTHSDPREIFTILGSALGGLPAAFLIGIIAGLPTSPEMRLASIFAHLLSAFFITLVYNYILASLKTKFLVLLWVILIPVNFIFILAPSFILGLMLFYHQQINFFVMLGSILSGAWVEILYTTIFTAAVMGALPKNLRKPIF